MFPKLGWKVDLVAVEQTDEASYFLMPSIGHERPAQMARLAIYDTSKQMLRWTVAQALAALIDGAAVAVVDGDDGVTVANVAAVDVVVVVVVVAAAAAVAAAGARRVVGVVKR